MALQNPMRPGYCPLGKKHCWMYAIHEEIAYCGQNQYRGTQRSSLADQGNKIKHMKVCPLDWRTDD